MLLITVLDVMQDLQGLLSRGRIHNHLLETTLQGTILLDVLSILVQRSRTDALNLATCQGWLQHISGIHRASRRAGSNDRMNLINK